MKKLNWIDIVIIFFITVVIFITANVISSFKRRSGNLQNSNEQKVILTVVVNDLWMETNIKLKNGDKINNTISQHTGKIINYKFESSPMLLTNVNGDSIGVMSITKQKVVLTIEANVLMAGSYIAFNGQEIKVGLPFVIKTNTLELTGKIQHIEVV